VGPASGTLDGMLWRVDGVSKSDGESERETERETERERDREGGELMALVSTRVNRV